MTGLELNIQALINHGSVYCVKQLNQLMQSSTDTYCKSVKKENAYCIVTVASQMTTHDQLEHICITVTVVLQSNTLEN